MIETRRIKQITHILFTFFNLRNTEVERFSYMLLHAFLSGLGIALSYTVVTSLIIETHNVHHLPLLYVITSFLLLASGYLYSKLEHAFQPARLFAAVLIALSLWGVAMSLNLRFAHDLLVISIAFCTYYLVYYLSNLEYWGSASLLFDVRQGKRLFGLLSVGESVAKIMGYAITPLIITLVDVSGVFMVVALSFGGAYLIFKKLTHEYRSSMVLAHHKTHHNIKSGTVITHIGWRKIFKGDRFKFFVSIFALISSLSLFLIHYAFLVRVEERFYDLEHIAVFIATLLTIAKFLNLSIKVFLSARLFQLVGLKTVLLLLPTTLLLISLTGVFGIFTGNASQDFIIWVFTIIFVADDVLRTSLYTPAYLTLFQPLTKAKRLEGHTLTKGIMEPIGIGIAGALILLLVQTDFFNLEAISYIIVFWLFAWIIAGLELYKSYLRILQNALKSKLLNRGTLKLNKEELRLLKEEKLHSPDPVEQLYALQMLGDRIPQEETRQLVEQLLKSDNNFVLASILDFIANEKVVGVEESLKKLIYHDDPVVSSRAIKQYSRIRKADCINFYMDIYTKVDQRTRNVLIAAAIKFGGLSGAIEFGKNLLEMIDSEDRYQRANAAKIIGEINNKSYYQPLVKLMADSDPLVVRSAIKASGQLGNNALLDPLLKVGQRKKLFLHTMKSLAHFGPELARKVRSHMAVEGPARDILNIKLISSNNELATTELYESCLDNSNFDTRKATINALFQRAYKASPGKSDTIEKLIDDHFNTMNLLLQYFQRIGDLQLRELIYNEIYHINLYLLYQLLAFKYSRKAITDVINNTYTQDKEFRSIAMELLENTLTPTDARKICPLIESVLDLSLTYAGNTYAEDEFELAKIVIRDGNRSFSSWMTANSLRFALRREPEIEIPDELQTTDIIIIKQELQIFAASKRIN